MFNMKYFIFLQSYTRSISGRRPSNTTTTTTGNHNNNNNKQTNKGSIGTAKLCKHNHMSMKRVNQENAFSFIYVLRGIHFNYKYCSNLGNRNVLVTRKSLAWKRPKCRLCLNFLAFQIPHESKRLRVRNAFVQEEIK